jgi:hypothetical protein
MDSRPSFIESWLDDTKDLYKAKGAWALFPVSLIVFACLAVGAAYFIPSTFFEDQNWDVSVTVYTGLLAFNALTLALAWSAIGRVYESITRTDFSAFLKAGGVLSKYLFYISFIHVAQAVAAFVTLISLVIVFMPVPDVYDRVCLGATLTATLFALRWALGAVTIVQDLSWHFASYDALGPDEKRQLHLAVNNDDTSKSPKGGQA